MSLHVQHPRSKQRLRQALSQLLLERPYTEITVSDLCAAGGVGRTTFYKYYKDREQLLGEIIDDLAQGLIDLMETAASEDFDHLLDGLVAQNHPVFLQYFQYMQQHADAFVTLLRPASGTDFEQRFRARIAVYRRCSQQRWARLDGGESDLLRSLYSTAMDSFQYALLAWVRDGMQVPAEKMAAHYMRVWLSWILLGDVDHAMYRRLVKRLRTRGLGALEAGMLQHTVPPAAPDQPREK